jgi:hypothetical protein
MEASVVLKETAAATGLSNVSAAGEPRLESLRDMSGGLRLKSPAMSEPMRCVVSGAWQKHCQLDSDTGLAIYMRGCIQGPRCSQILSDLVIYGTFARVQQRRIGVVERLGR